MKCKVGKATNRSMIILAMQKKNYFYYTIPSDSEETDSEESDLECDFDEQKQILPRFQDDELAAAGPSIWFFSEDNSENSLSSTSSRDKMESVNSSDNEELNFKGLPRLQSRECVPKSDDATVFGDTPPKVPSRIRFKDEPEIIYYDQVTEYESDVFDQRYEEFLRMKKECEKGISAAKCEDSDDEDDLNDDEDVSNDIAVTAVADKEMKSTCMSCRVLNDKNETVEGVGISSYMPDKCPSLAFFSSCICGRVRRSPEETFACNSDDVGDRWTEETSGYSCDDLDESTGEKSIDSTDESGNFSDDYQVPNDVDSLVEKVKSWQDWKPPHNSPDLLKVVS